MQTSMEAVNVCEHSSDVGLSYSHRWNLRRLKQVECAATFQGNLPKNND